MRLSRRFFRLACLAFSLALLMGILPVSSSVPFLSAFGSETVETFQQVIQPSSAFDIQAILPEQLGSVNAKPVYLDGRTIFSVTSFEGGSAAKRARVITRRLGSIARQSKGQTPKIDWTLDQDSQLPILRINDKVLMTVTKSDAQLSGMGQPSFLADEWIEQLHKALARYQQERQPESLWRHGAWAAIGLVVILTLSFGVSRIQEATQRQLKKHSFTNDFAPDLAQRVNQQDLQHHVTEKQVQSWIALQRWVCRIGQGIIWGGGLLALIGLFPYTRQFRPGVLRVLILPLKVAAIALLIYGLIRFGNVLIDRLFLWIQTDDFPKKSRSKRLALRFSTVSRVTKNVVATCLIATGVLIGLSILGLELGPLLAGAGIIGLALSFASQNVLKDVINGFLILLEDQFGVGDVIVVGDVAGFVENMNLRITQLRNEEGRLITIPNGQISIIQNLSKEWSRVDLLIPVSLESDIDHALDLIYQVAVDMWHTPEWSDLILEDPLVLGVDQLDHAGAVVRLWIMTQPLKQWDVAREYRRRLKIAFDQANIGLGVPQQSLHIHPAQALLNSYPKPVMQP